MNNKEKILLSYLAANVAPILVEDAFAESLKNVVTIEADCSISLLNGHYEETKFVAPSWYGELVNKKDNKVVLLIKNINMINKDEQSKFVEILKYRKIATFDLPDNCVIMATYNDLKNHPLNEEIYSLCAHV